MGIGPMTFSLPRKRSTTEPRRRDVLGEGFAICFRKSAYCSINYYNRCCNSISQYTVPCGSALPKRTNRFDLSPNKKSVVNETTNFLCWEQDSNLRRPFGRGFYRSVLLATQSSQLSRMSIKTLGLSRWRGSNSRHHVYKTCALPLSYTGGSFLVNFTINLF